jgi:hypothetical protein
LRFEFNMDNLFNQKTSMFLYNRYNREEYAAALGIDVSGVDLSKGFDWRALVLDTPEGSWMLDPRYRQDAMFNPGFAGRFLVKFVF